MMDTPHLTPCLSDQSHAWGEWYYSEAQAGAVRRCHTYGSDYAKTTEFLDGIERWSRRMRVQ